MKLSQPELTIVLRALKEVSTQQYNRYQVMKKNPIIPALVLNRYEVEVDEYLTLIQQIESVSPAPSFKHCRHCDDELMIEDDNYNGLCQSCATRLTTTLN